MLELKNQVQSLVADEYGRATKKFGPTNNSDHESYSILLEELDEAVDELKDLKVSFNAFWDLTKANGSTTEKQACLSAIQQSAIYAACEMIQVAAMAYKAKVTNSCLLEAKGVKGDVTNKQ